MFSTSDLRVEDVFQKCWEIFIDYNQERFIAHPKTYLFTIALNLIKRQGKKSAGNLNPAIDVETLIDQQNETIESYFENLEADNKAKKSLATYLQDLSKNKPEYFTVIYLRFFEEMKFKEIALIVESTESTVKSRYLYGLNILKQKFEKKSYE